MPGGNSAFWCNRGDLSPEREPAAASAVPSASPCAAAQQSVLCVCGPTGRGRRGLWQPSSVPHGPVQRGLSVQREPRSSADASSKPASSLRDWDFSGPGTLGVNGMGWSVLPASGTCGSPASFPLPVLLRSVLSPWLWCLECCHGVQSPEPLCALAQRSPQARDLQWQRLRS